MHVPCVVGRVGVVNEVVVMVVGWCEGGLGCMWCGGGCSVAFGITFS